MHRASRLSVLAVLAATAVAGTASAANHTVSMADMQFVPKNLTIHVGDTVTWRNNGAMVHTSTGGNPCRGSGAWDSGFMDPGATFTPAVNPFIATGTFNYFCYLHCGMGMTGTITVETPVATHASTWGAIKALYRIVLE